MRSDHRVPGRHRRTPGLILRLFVTGTDTGVGKTVVTGLLGLGSGRPVAKPLISGIDELPTDLQRLERFTGRPTAVFQQWRTPVAPHRAALLEQAPLDVPALRTWIASLPADALVEGVGGWRVPLAPGFEQVDLARDVGTQVLVVAADRLGVLNHTRLTVDAVRAEGFEVVAVVLNQFQADASTPWNLEDLAACVSVPVVTIGPVHEGDPAGVASAARVLAERIEALRRSSNHATV